MFDNDKDGVLSIKEFEKVLTVLGRSGGNLKCQWRCEGASENAEKIARGVSTDQAELSVSFNEYL